MKPAFFFIVVLLLASSTAMGQKKIPVPFGMPKKSLAFRSMVTDTVKTMPMQHNMPIIGMNIPKPGIVGENQQGYTVWESPVDGMRGIAPGEDYKTNMPVGKKLNLKQPAEPVVPIQDTAAPSKPGRAR